METKGEEMNIIWNNVFTTHHRIMANFLKKRGWVCFYLDEESRHCYDGKDGCWLKLYQESEKKR